MKRIFLLFAVFAFTVLPVTCIADSLKPDQAVVFSDGSKAATYSHCGDSDLCAKVEYPNGNKLAIYSEGAAYCQPYILHFVEANGQSTVFEYSRTINHDMPRSSAFGTNCGNSRDTQMVMDHGFIHMTVTENSDGTLSIAFTPTHQGTMRQQSSEPPYAPTPSPSQSP